MSPETTSLPDGADVVKGLEDTEVEESGITAVRQKKKKNRSKKK